MKRTEFKVVVSYGISHGATYRRVYEDENGQKYIRENGSYKCIEDLPCIRYLVRN